MKMCWRFCCVALCAQPCYGKLGIGIGELFLLGIGMEALVEMDMGVEF